MKYKVIQSRKLYNEQSLWYADSTLYMGYDGWPDFWKELPLEKNQNETTFSK